MKIWEKIQRRREYIARKFLSIVAPHYHKILWIHLTATNVPRPFTTYIKKKFKNKPVTGAEIGVYEGENSENIMKELNMKKLYIVDPWITYEGHSSTAQELELAYNQVKNMFSKNEKVEIIKDSSIKSSKKIKDDSLDFVYIDADHRYEKVYQDIESWFPKVKIGGIMGGHDIMLIKDVTQAVSDWCVENGKKYVIDTPDWYLIK